MFVGGLELESPSIGGGAHLARVFDAIATGIVEHNRMLIRLRLVPPLYSTNVVYGDDPNGKKFGNYAISDTWRDALATWKQGWGDCKLLSAWRAAELREQGYDVRVGHRWWCCPFDGEVPWQFHAIVVDPLGRLVDDPSARLGMIPLSLEAA